MFGDDGIENVPHRDWLLEFDRVSNEFKEEMRDQGREDDFLGCKARRSLIAFFSQLTRCAGYLLHTPICDCRGTRVVLGRLHRLEARVPKSNLWSVVLSCKSFSMKLRHPPF